MLLQILPSTFWRQRNRLEMANAIQNLVYMNHLCHQLYSHDVDQAPKVPEKPLDHP